jgi:hypothetical protein
MILYVLGTDAKKNGHLNWRFEVRKAFFKRYEKGQKFRKVSQSVSNIDCEIIVEACMKEYRHDTNFN